MYLDFSNDFIRQIVLNTTKVDYENTHSPADAFLILLKDIDYETIENLCIEISKKLSLENPHNIYDKIQSNSMNEAFKDLILETAYEIIHTNKKLGNKKIKGQSNTSNWISHCLYEGELASTLANSLNLDGDTAKKLGILHDIGRKFDHSFMHTIKGFEYLYNLGYKEDAFCCLTHSFLPIYKNGEYKGNRCANCDLPIEGFFVDSKGRGVFKKGSRTDDITKFLNQYCYNQYDVILNMADLMATAEKIVSPYDRIMDIYTRKPPDERNNTFFKVCFIDFFHKALLTLKGNKEYTDSITINDFQSIEEIDTQFQNISNEFWRTYTKLLENDSKKYRSKI